MSTLLLALALDLGPWPLTLTLSLSPTLTLTPTLLKASAAAHGRCSVGVVDALAVLPHVLWEEPEDASALDEWLEAHPLPEAGVEQLRFLLSSLHARVAEAEAEVSGEAAASVEDTDGASPSPAQLGSMTQRLEEDATALALAAVEATAEMRAHAVELERARDHLFVAPTRAAVLVQRLAPEARRREGELTELATRAVAMEMVLREGLGSGGVERLLSMLGSEGGGDCEDGSEGGSDEGDEEGERQADSCFSAEELQWGRKEAKSRLNAEEYRAWRKAAKKRKS